MHSTCTPLLACVVHVHVRAHPLTIARARARCQLAEYTTRPHHFAAADDGGDGAMGEACPPSWAPWPAMAEGDAGGDVFVYVDYDMEFTGDVWHEPTGDWLGEDWSTQ